MLIVTQIAFSMASSATLHSLPLEILTLIFAPLSHTDLLSLSLASRRLRSTACTLLFATINLKCNLDSFFRLSSISSHPIFRQHVYKISYDGRELFDLGSKVFEEDFGGWVRRHAGTGLPFRSFREARRFVSRFSTDQLRHFHRGYLDHVKGQREIKKGGNEKRLLGEAMRMFPRLTGIEYATDRMEGEELSLRTMSYIARGTLAEPYSTYSYDESHFWSLLDAATTYALPTLQSIKGAKLGYDQWARGATKRIDNLKALSGVESLDLEFHYHKHQCENNGALAGFLACTHSLRSLRISFSTLLFNKETIYGLGSTNSLVDFIPKNQGWRCLQHVELRAMSSTQAELEAFLLLHAPTLRSLRLADWLFAPGSGSSWISFLVFLRVKLSLTFAKFRGTLHNGRMEHWRVPEGRVEVSEPCLRSQIEDFVTRRSHHFPFKPRGDAEVVEGSFWAGRVDIGWMWDERDESWVFDGSRFV